MTTCALKRAIRYHSDVKFYSIRRWCGQVVNRTSSDILSATMSDETRANMVRLLEAARTADGEWVEYPND